MPIFNAPFKITIPSDEFDRLRKDHQFKKILRLARFVNQLAFCLSAVRGSKSEEIGHGRQFANSILFMAAVLHEALRAYELLESDFGHKKYYKNGCQSIFDDPGYLFIAEHLHNTRDRITFHIDTQIYKETLKWVEFDEYVFLKGSDGRADNIHFVLADDLAMNFLAGEHDSDETQLAYMKDFIDKTTRFVTLFLRAANDLLYEYAVEKGWPLSDSSKER